MAIINLPRITRAELMAAVRAGYKIDAFPEMQWADLFKPVPPVPLPVYPHTTVGLCRTCGCMIAITGVVLPKEA